jgi:hypothetical protein
VQGQLVPVKDTIVGVVGQAVAALSGVNETVKALGNEQLDAFATMHADIQVPTHDEQGRRSRHWTVLL